MTLRALISCDYPAGVTWQAGEVRDYARLAPKLPPGSLPWWLVLEGVEPSPAPASSLAVEAAPDPLSAPVEGQE